MSDETVNPKYKILQSNQSLKIYIWGIHLHYTSNIKIVQNSFHHINEV